MIFATRPAPWAHCVAHLSHCIKPVCAQNGASFDPVFSAILMNEREPRASHNQPLPFRQRALYWRDVRRHCCLSI